MLSYLSGIDYILYINDIFIDKYHRDLFLPKSKYKQFFVHKLFDDILKSANMVVSNHKDYLKQIQKYRKDEIPIIINPLDYEIFNAEIPSNRMDKFTFLLPTRIEPIKGIKLLCESIKLTKSDFIVHMVDWKSDAHKSYYQDIINNLSNKITLIPKIPHKEIASRFRQYHAVMGSIVREYAPMIEKEAIACSVPVFHSAEIGYDGDYPFYKGSRDPAKIAKYIDRMVQDDQFLDQLQREQYKWLKNTINNETIVNEWSQTLCKANSNRRGNTQGKYLFMFRLWSIFKRLKKQKSL